MRTAVAWVVVLAVLAGCSGGRDGGAGDATTTSEPDATAASTGDGVLASGDCFGGARPSSPALFDAASGTYPVRLTAVDGDRVTFNVVQHFTGEDADAAHAADRPEESGGPPNDYYLRDGDDELRTAPAAGARVLLLRYVRVSDDGGDGFVLYEADVEELADLVPARQGGLFWLTFVDGAITEVCEPYVP